MPEEKSIDRGGDAPSGQVAKERTVIVTGGSRGWGRAIVLRFAEPGTTIVLNYASNADAAASSAHDATARGAHVVLARGDISDPATVTAVIEAAHSTGRLDVLVHNAFHMTTAPPLELGDDDFDRAMDVGPKSLLALLRAGVGLFPETGGHVVSTLSLATQRLFHVSRGSGYFPMAAAKGALEVCVRYLAVDLAPRHVTVNGVAAGYIATEGMMGEGREAFRHQISAKTPLGRIASPEEVAEVVHFLGSDASRWVTGQIVTADGGFSLV